MLKGLSDYDLVQFCISYGGISLLTAHSLLLRACNTAGVGFVVSLCSHISLFRFAIVQGHCFVCCSCQDWLLFQFKRNSVVIHGFPDFASSERFHCNYLPCCFWFQISLRYWYPKTQTHWMCKQLLSIGAYTNVRTSRLASGCWKSEGYDEVAAVDLKV